MSCTSVTFLLSFEILSRRISSAKFDIIKAKNFLTFTSLKVCHSNADEASFPPHFPSMPLFRPHTNYPKTPKRPLQPLYGPGKAISAIPSSRKIPDESSDAFAHFPSMPLFRPHVAQNAFSAFHGKIIPEAPQTPLTAPLRALESHLCISLFPKNSRRVLDFFPHFSSMPLFRLHVAQNAFSLSRIQITQRPLNVPYSPSTGPEKPYPQFPLPEKFPTHKN